MVDSLGPISVIDEQISVKRGQKNLVCGQSVWNLMTNWLEDIIT